MKKYLFFLFMAVLLLLDGFVLIFFYQTTAAPPSYYICFWAVLAVTLLFLLYWIFFRKKLRADIKRYIPFCCTLAILLLSLLPLYSGIRDLTAKSNPEEATLTQVEFSQTKHTLFGISLGNTYCMEGTDPWDKKVSIAVTKKEFDTYSYLQPKGSLDKDSPEIRYKYAPDSKFIVKYLPVSKKAVHVLETTPSPLTYKTNVSKEIQAEITKITDSSTIEASITADNDAYGLKKGDAVILNGSMTILYPYNVQGFYEFKEGDQIYFNTESIEDEDTPILHVSVLNLQTEDAK